MAKAVKIGSFKAPSRVPTPKVKRVPAMNQRVDASGRPPLGFPRNSGKAKKNTRDYGKDPMAYTGISFGDTGLTGES
jgi:hypothetical protein